MTEESEARQTDLPSPFAARPEFVTYVPAPRRLLMAAKTRAYLAQENGGEKRGLRWCSLATENRAYLVQLFGFLFPRRRSLGLHLLRFLEAVAIPVDLQDF